MKVKIVIALYFIFLCAGVFAQGPEKMSYQAVVRNIDGSILAVSQVGLKIGVIQGSTNGERVYEEVHNQITNENGLVSLQIGSGDVTFGDFSEIDWYNGSFFLETKMDLEGGSNYTLTGLTELLSVPYALHSNTASSLVSSDGDYTLRSKVISLQNGRAINVDDIGNIIECKASATLVLTSNFDAMEIGDTINLEAHNGANLTIAGDSAVQINYVMGGSATFESETGNVRFGLLRKMGVNSYIISGQ
ncbi:hypothetical protein [Maribacter dokdonensis]|uniref:hypothetical protein n=1 Tax=Maribacter dokdonensis TaxID=320912 RepID=UPI0007199222|nr:hypothetical protein [Maribacter dokdonensis]KSA15228.1 Legionella vir region protein [Maribacter dokdonensis DSW-8]